MLEQCGCFGAARIHDHDLASACGDVEQYVADPSGRHQTSVRHNRIGAEDEREMGVAEIGQ